MSGTYPTLFLTPRHTTDAQALWRAASVLGWQVERLTGWHVPEEYRRIPKPVLYLEGLMAPMLAQEFGLELLEPPEDWLPNLPENYRKRTLRLSDLGTARRLTEPHFIKPPNDKSFPAAVYLGKDLPAEFPADMPVLISEVVRWTVEFRCFLLDRRIRSFSVYLRNGVLQRDSGFRHSPEEERELTTFMEVFLGDVQVPLPRGAVVDCGILEGKGWAVVEQNAAWGSGIYGCDPVEVLQVLEHCVRPIDPKNAG